MSELPTKADAFFNALGHLIFRRPWWIIGGGALAMGLAVAPLPDITFDTSNEGFLHEGDPVLLEYNAFRDQFGRDDLILLALSPPEVFGFPFLTKLRALHERLEEELPHLDEVTSLINARTTRCSLRTCSKSGRRTRTTSQR